MATEQLPLHERVNRTISLQKRTGEAVILVGLGVLGLFTVVYSQLTLPLDNPMGAGVGPRLFPQLAGATMILMSVYLLGERFYRRRQNTVEDETIEMEVQDILRVLVVIVISAGYMILFESLGFLIATSAVLFLLFVTNGLSRPVLAAVLAVGFTVTIYLMFRVALKLPLPAPILNEIFAGVL